MPIEPEPRSEQVIPTPDVFVDDPRIPGNAYAAFGSQFLQRWINAGGDGEEGYNMYNSGDPNVVLDTKLREREAERAASLLVSERPESLPVIVANPDLQHVSPIASFESGLDDQPDELKTLPINVVVTPNENIEDKEPSRTRRRELLNRALTPLKQLNASLSEPLIDIGNLRITRRAGLLTAGGGLAASMIGSTSTGRRVVFSMEDSVNASLSDNDDSKAEYDNASDATPETFSSPVSSAEAVETLKEDLTIRQDGLISFVPIDQLKNMANNMKVETLHMYLQTCSIEDPDVINSVKLVSVIQGDDGNLQVSFDDGANTITTAFGDEAPQEYARFTVYPDALNQQISLVITEKELGTTDDPENTKKGIDLSPNLLEVAPNREAHLPDIFIEVRRDQSQKQAREALDPVLDETVAMTQRFAPFVGKEKVYLRQSSVLANTGNFYQTVSEDFAKGVELSSTIASSDTSQNAAVAEALATSFFAKRTAQQSTAVDQFEVVFERAQKLYQQSLSEEANPAKKTTTALDVINTVVNAKTDGNDPQIMFGRITAALVEYPDPLYQYLNHFYTTSDLLNLEQSSALRDLISATFEVYKEKSYRQEDLDGLFGKQNLQNFAYKGLITYERSETLDYATPIPSPVYSPDASPVAQNPTGLSTTGADTSAFQNPGVSVFLDIPEQYSGINAAPRGAVGEPRIITGSAIATPNEHTDNP